MARADASGALICREHYTPFGETAIEHAEARLAARFDREKEKGTLPPGFPSGERAALLFDIRQGFMFRARDGWDRERLQRDKFVNNIFRCAKLPLVRLEAGKSGPQAELDKVIAAIWPEPADGRTAPAKPAVAAG